MVLVAICAGLVMAKASVSDNNHHLSTKAENRFIEAECFIIRSLPHVELWLLLAKYAIVFILCTQMSLLFLVRLLLGEDLLE